MRVGIGSRQKRKKVAAARNADRFASKSLPSPARRASLLEGYREPTADGSRLLDRRESFSLCRPSRGFL